MTEEALRIQTLTNGEKERGLYLRVSGSDDPDAARTLSRMREAMLLFAEASDGLRLSDDEWKGRLPYWLQASFQWEVTWSFPVWLDFMVDRTWEWWSSELTSNSWTVYVLLYEMPNSSDAFLWIAEAARGTDQIEGEFVCVE